MEGYIALHRLYSYWDFIGFWDTILNNGEPTGKDNGQLKGSWEYAGVT